MLTKRQKQTLDFILWWERSEGYSPSFAEIAQGMGLKSIATVHKHVKGLQEKGYIRREFKSMRAIRVVGFPVVMQAIQ